AHARNETPIKHIYTPKPTPSHNPLILHIYKVQQIQPFTHNLSKQVQILINQFSPPPISFILPLKKPYLSQSVSGGLHSIPLPIPTHPIPTQILKYLHIPIPPPTANFTPTPSPTTFQHLYPHF
ncbi:Sua5/YciO/YrdC/YwlC family protein, partial [Staphylococcus saprophyticus]|uniref:Sua5/YciO/YrdC/YwlC family protein n=1 Tax=Staphylococcus saprophyticus TaxID=29385 RepID=UPI0011A3C7E0